MFIFKKLPVIQKQFYLALLLLPCIAFADDFTDMPDDVGKLETFVECSRCHSMQIVNQQGLTRSAWEKLMVWMVEEQSMVAMTDENETLVVDYLSKYYSPEAKKEKLQARGRPSYP